MIVLEDVCKKFREGMPVKHVTAEFHDGEITGIVGHNGSGKTLLFKMICGLMPSSHGTIVVNGEQVGKDVDFPSSIGVIIETPGFLKWQTARECLMELAGIRKRIGRDEVEEVLVKVGLDPKSKKKVGKYSLGMRQRLGIAQAIMEDPDVLVLDEPLNGLDRQGVEEMRTLLLGLKAQGKTILIASHNREDIDLLGDAVYEMENGEMKKVN